MNGIIAEIDRKGICCMPTQSNWLVCCAFQNTFNTYGCLICCPAQMSSEVLAGDDDQDLTGEVRGDGAASGSQAPAADETRLTTKYMTKYERARIIGTRALQLR